jgi:hypothetical protein
MLEVKKPAFVKLSTAFKSELKGISGDALKVWMFIALSINRKTGKANPGLRTIAEETGLAVNTVQDRLRELEGLNLLVVDRQSRRYNQYESPEYVSANRAEPTVSPDDTDGSTVSNSSATVSNSGQTVSTVRGKNLLNQINQSNQNGSYEPKTLEEAIFSGRPITEGMLSNDNAYKDVANLIGMGMGILATSASALAVAFMEERGITIPQSKVKGQRKILREMLEMNVKPEHVRQAVKDLMEKGMTVVDLYSVAKTAEALASAPAKEQPVDTRRAFPKFGPDGRRIE